MLDEEAKVAVISKRAGYMASLYGRPFTLISPVESQYIKTKILIYGGGTQFYSFAGASFLIKKIAHLISNPYLLLRKVSGKKGLIVDADRTIYFGVGLGPFQSKAKLSETLRLLAKADNIYVRDKKSLAYLDGGGLRCDVSVVPDICVMDRASYRATTKEMKGGVKEEKVGVILRDWPYSEDAGLILDSVLKLREKIDMPMEFVFFGRDEKNKAHLTKLGVPFKEWDPDHPSGLDEFHAMIGEYKLIITSRYHGVVFSAINYVPTIIIGIEDKLVQAADEFSEVGCLWAKPYDLNKGVALFDYSVGRNIDKAALDSYLESGDEILEHEIKPAIRGRQ